MTEKRYIVNADCLYNEILDTKFGSNGVDKPTKQEVEDKEYLIVCDVFPKSVADKLCERLNRYEEESKVLQKENEELKSEIEKVQREYEQLWMRTYLKEDKNCEYYKKKELEE